MHLYLIINFNDSKYSTEVLKNSILVERKYLVLKVQEMIKHGKIDWDVIREGDYTIEEMSTDTAIKLLEDCGYILQEYEI